MNDLISRRTAIIQLSHNKTGDDDCDVIIQNDIETIKALPSTQPEPSIEIIEEILNYLDTTLHPIVSPDNWNVYSELYDMVSSLPSAQPESNCFGCKHAGMWEDEVEYGYPSPCTRCKRRANDNYEQ